MSVSAKPTDLFTLRPNVDHRTTAAKGLETDIVQYYDECYVDYRVLWLDGKNLAIHYGYWDEATKTHSQSLVNMNKVLADAVAIDSSELVLDAGCGLGGSSIWIAENYDAEVIGITLAESQMRRARKFARKRGVAGQVRFETADYCHTPFQDQSFDVVWGLESVCYAMDKQAFVKEAYRLLRPGGRLVVADGFAGKTEFTPKEWRSFTKFLDGWAVPNLATPDEFEGYLKGCGFRDIRFTDITRNVMPSAKQMYQRAVFTTPIQKALSWLKIRTAAQNRNYAAALHQMEVLDSGMSCYGMFAARRAV